MPREQSVRYESRAENLLAEAFRRAGWKVEEEPQFGHHRLDLLVRKDHLAYAIEIKKASEGRSDRLVPLISQAILEAQAAALAVGQGISPLAVVHAPRIPESAAANVHRFAMQYAPGVAVGVFDLEGFQSFFGPNLEALNKKPASSDRSIGLYQEKPKMGLFSGINQWLLKVMLAPMIPESILAAPRDEYRNASRLAQAAGVSVMSAFRFVKQLQDEGFLHESGDSIRLVRIVELMQQWQTAGSNWREIRMKWMIRKNDPNALLVAVRSAFLPSSPDVPVSYRFSFAGGPSSDPRVYPPVHGCVGLFAAAELLGLSFVHGAPRHLYIERPDRYAIHQLGLVVARENEPVDVYVRIPSARASVFRGAVDVNGVPVSDILQVWLDVGAHPARGSAQADQIWNRVLAPRLEAK